MRQSAANTTYTGIHASWVRTESDYKRIIRHQPQQQQQYTAFLRRYMPMYPERYKNPTHASMNDVFFFFTSSSPVQEPLVPPSTKRNYTHLYICLYCDAPERKPERKESIHWHTESSNTHTYTQTQTKYTSTSHYGEASATSRDDTITQSQKRTAYIETIVSLPSHSLTLHTCIVCLLLCFFLSLSLSSFDKRALII